MESLRENPNRFWFYINNKLTNKDKNRIERIKVDGKVLENPKIMAEALSDHFYKSFNHDGDLHSFRTHKDSTRSHILGTEHCHDNFRRSF